MKAWLFQDHRQKQKLGDKAPWSVGWLNEEGHRRSKRIGTRSNAEKYQRRIEGQLAAGTYEDTSRKQWPDFRREYEQTELPKKAVNTQRLEKRTLDSFERIARPCRMRAIRTKTIDEYARRRSNETSRKSKLPLAVATVNAELRMIKLILRVAVEWEYLSKPPKVRMLKEPSKLPRYVAPDHFAKLYAACGQSRRPTKIANVAPADWWRGLITFGYMTGWRIGEILALRWDDVDLDAATAITRHEDNKGGRDESVPLHPVVIEHLLKIRTFYPRVFPWLHNRRTLDIEFHAIQQAAAIHLPCRQEHEHTAACHLYGFHDLRRAFATANAPRMTADALQKLMRHKSYTTTQRYISMADQLTTAVADLQVPDVLAKAADAS